MKGSGKEHWPQKGAKSARQEIIGQPVNPLILLFFASFAPFCGYSL
jgi:hypothetical protein